ncbi:aminoglycoside phosphotransferase [Bifidobacterium samirii]|uniref:Aminoglycoside phosphotransferase n=2 Tax=Bifidobacterium samirii TaxID=2306974 RepID=A0A430FVH7_9BIFI|nr:phosphotransferase [Bifidobacterium samirii]RSX57750.1 aminoglycoside phosphotransferase [Bifidobacterium samirii]
MLAALASAAMPNVTVTGVRPAPAYVAADEACGIDHAVVQDASGRSYDVFVSDAENGRRRLAERVRAAQALALSREIAGLGVGIDRIVAFEKGDDAHGPTGRTAVLVAAHHDGEPRNLDLLTLDDCAAIGTAIGAIHRLSPATVRQSGYPEYATAQIHAQLTAWIARLRTAGHVPPEITASWERIIETEGLWAFATCFVHGGFEDGDVLFAGSTITAIGNWQNMQVNDPARDLAWIFAKLNEEHRNAVLAAYGRIMGSRLDDLIMLRANLWLQMEQVGEFIQALNHADNARIMQFKAQVDRLAHQLDVAAQRSASTGGANRTPGAKPPSTITVGTLLREGERRRAAAQAAAATQAGGAVSDSTGESVVANDATGDMDATGSAGLRVHDTTGSAPRIAAQAGGYPSSAATQAAPRPSTSPTIVVDRMHFELGGPSSSDAAVYSEPYDRTGESAMQQAYDAHPPLDPAQANASYEAQTMLIPLLEQEERALRDAQAGLEAARFHAAGMPATGSSVAYGGADAAGAAGSTGATVAVEQTPAASGTVPAYDGQAGTPTA